MATTTDDGSPLYDYINKTLRITTTDARLFVGELKCTDRDKNLILSCTSEYRYPTAQQVLREAEEQEQEQAENAAAATKVTLGLQSRYIGLVVVPGEFVTKVEVQA
ncbi:hypothetical protein EDC01DRAFT_611675 [Geopyxis carbonaria]|nr:hypothetical protein EDC01DRAFT_611675 [Geopyxis carbonaria]